MRTLELLLALSLCSLPATAGVIVVDASGSGFTQIQPAVDAAVDGDVILVRSGSYAAFAIDDEALSVVADTGASVSVNGGIDIFNLAAGKTVVLAGLTSTGNASLSSPAIANGLRVRNCLGAVRVEDCDLVGSGGNPGHAALYAGLARDLSLHDSDLVGGGGFFYITGGTKAGGGHGAEVAGSVVSFHDTSVRGAQGAFGDDLGDGAPGGHGLWAYAESSAPTLATRVHGAGSVFTGANGTTDQLCFVAGQGGDAVRLEDLGTAATLLDNTYTHGSKGGCGCCGTDGLDIRTLGGAVAQIKAGTARDLTAATPLRELDLLNLEAEGEPGDVHLVLLSGGTMQAYVPPYSGTQLITLPLLPPSILKVLVQTGPGPVAGSFQTGQLPAGFDNLTLFTQLVTLDSAGTVWLGSPETLVLVDSAF